MEISVVYCCAGVVAIFVWRFLSKLWLEPKKKEKFLRKQGLDGTSYRFMVGDFKEMTRMTSEVKSKPMSLTHDIAHHVSPFIYNSLATYGKTCFTWMGPKPIVHISEPAMIREILGNYYKFQKPKSGSPLSKLLVSGLIDVDGDQWVKHRKIINPAFLVEKLKVSSSSSLLENSKICDNFCDKHMLPAFYVSCNELIQKWGEMIGEVAVGEVDVWPDLQKFTSDVISRTAFGSSFEEGRKIFDLQNEQAKLVLKAAQKMFIPGYRFLPTKTNKRMQEIDRKVKGLIRAIIDKRVALMNQGETSNDDLLGILLDSNYREIKQQKSKDFGLSIEEVIEECKLFYFAGQETSANMLVWTMILLAHHKDWQTRARDEVLGVLGKRKPDIDGLNHLKLINMISNESLRLYPPAIALRRETQEETKLGNITLPAQTQIRINSLFLQHDQTIWGDDANEFKPERFSEGVSKVTKGQYSYLPFGGGPRICIGQNFAMLEAKMGLVMILQTFSFELSPSYSHAPHTVLLLQPQFGAHLTLHKL